MTIIDAECEVRTALETATAAAGLTVQEMGHGHFRIYGVRRAVNYYPYSANRTANIDGKKGVKGCSVQTVINMAQLGAPA
jgi:hypothetical protein